MYLPINDTHGSNMVYLHLPINVYKNVIYSQSDSKKMFVHFGRWVCLLAVTQ